MTKKFQIIKSVGKNKVEVWNPLNEETSPTITDGWRLLLTWQQYVTDFNKINFEILSNTHDFEHVESDKVSSDADFYVKCVNQNISQKHKLKNTLNGKIVYGIKGLLKSQRSVSQYHADLFTDPNSIFLKDILPMILSKDSPTKLLGYQWILKNVNHEQMCTLHNLFKLNVYPYCEIHGKKESTYVYDSVDPLKFSMKQVPYSQFFKSGDELTTYQSIAEQIIKIRASQRPRA